MDSLTLVLPDPLSRNLKKHAQREGQSPNEFVLRLLEKNLQDAEEDPLLQVLGSLASDTPDLGKQHDAYLAEAQRSNGG